ncbi:uncharacterized protein APUU_11250S [Aspergillus puulaauensis]|uniref:Transmembrane protein n=1 Tax=Aspergillus puulaauensis TaxID=1220207 RepID=A0A7R7XBL0_9EURO|nr:uncharacterized protein APUU_11250S [Aspergillus puulaauensis]BCS18422.1 hypothetical protein APUU_11250S [Aspergillus puulaauensis]
MPPPPLNLNLNLQPPPSDSPLNNNNLNTDTNTDTSILPLIKPRADSSETANHITHNAISIPSTYGRTSNPPNPGVIVGATLGAVAGFLLLLYLLYLGLTSGRRFSASTIGATSTTPSEIVDVGFRNRGARSGYGGPGGRRRREDEVIVEESLTSRSRTDGGGVVEVEEEESVIDPPPSSRYRSRSRSSRSSSRTRSDRYRRHRGGGGVRGVDPMAYGGGSEFSERS